MADKLKPCPFCGGEARKQAKEIEGIRVLYVLCERCGASGGVFRTRKPRVKDEENPAIKAWNRRKPIEQILEQLKELREATEYGGCPDGECLNRCEKHYMERAISIVKGVQNENS